jgi:hypothetical protein
MLFDFIIKYDTLRLEMKGLPVTTLLTKAVKQVSKLPETLQDQIAEQLLEDLKMELKWNESLEKSDKQLEKMADKALDEFKKGKTKKMGFGEL